MLQRFDRERIVLYALAAAWLGLWGAWIPNAAASLSQNVFYLAEWSTFLPGVRSGEIRLAPEALRLTAALGTLAIVFAAQDIRDVWVRWLVRVVAAVPVLFVLMPPYPDVFQLWWSPSYGARFGAASVLLIGVVASAFIGRFAPPARRWATAVTCVLAVISAVAGLAYLLPPFQANYAAPLGAGWGISSFFAGMAIAAVAQIAPDSAFRQVGEKQNGPVA